MLRAEHFGLDAQRRPQLLLRLAELTLARVHLCQALGCVGCLELRPLLRLFRRCVLTLCLCALTVQVRLCRLGCTRSGRFLRNLLGSRLLGTLFGFLFFDFHRALCFHSLNCSLALQNVFSVVSSYKSLTGHPALRFGQGACCTRLCWRIVWHHDRPRHAGAECTATTVCACAVGELPAAPFAFGQL